jgi:hypothetical protein
MMAAMVVCPVCEHQQALGEECQVCGAKLAGPGVVPVPVEPLPGLESTSLGAAGPVTAGAIPDLELTRHGAVAVAASPAPDLEPTRADPVNVTVEAVPGLEQTRGEPIPGDGPTPRPTSLTCRYCRAENPPSQAICGRCGMRLPVWEGAAAAPPLEPGEAARCAACGTLNAGEICTGCGALVRR